MDKALIEHTQRGLAALVNPNQPVTGNYFAITTGNGEILVKRLKAYFKKMGYTWDPGGNLIGFRIDDAIDNEFTDWGCIVTAAELVILFPMSTLPGSLYMQQNDTLGGIVLEGQYDCYKIQDAWWSGMPFLYQDGAVDYLRDVNHDLRVDRNGTKYNGLQGFNFHSYKSPKGWFWNETYVSGKLAGVLSKGCQVIQANIHNLIWPTLSQVAANRHGRVRYTLIRKSEF